MESIYTTLDYKFEYFKNRWQLIEQKVENWNDRLFACSMRL
jgi:hypothetical protein